MRERVKRVLYAVRLAGMLAVMVFVASSQFGCEEDPTRPAECGVGPFSFDEKTGICRRLSDNARVDDECCNY